jgi:subtilisin family serine protease
VHETAPGAELFLICADSLDGLENAKDYAISRGVRVINMSGSFVGYSRGDGSGDPGTPDEIIADARTRGVLWVNAAGNWGDGHWSGLFDDPDHDALLNFAPTDNGNAIRLATGETTCALLKWDEWPVTDEDYDLFLVRQRDIVDVERSMNVQDGTQPPVEFLCYRNPGPDAWYWFVVRRNGGGTPVRLDLFATQTLAHVVPDGSIDEQAASPSAFAVGAVCWQNGLLRPYSSRGPTIDGRVKPEIVAPDGVSSGTYGISAGCSGGFQGTSASAPYVAGAAALVKQAHPAFSMGQLQEFLETRAIDSGPPGLDNHYGVGRLSLGPPPAVVPPPPQPPPADAFCVVPRLRGMLLARAKQAIRASGCSVGKVRRAYSTRVPRGRVVGQSPKAGRRLAQGHAVNLVQSRGRRPARSQNR